MSDEVSEDVGAVHSALNVDNVVHIDADHADGVIRVRHIAANGVDILEATDEGSGTLTMRIETPDATKDTSQCKIKTTRKLKT